ncbi:MAG TPA: SDR family NAD(P)-dependent oxidoreductase [Sphingomicrobium sp.]|nr:SDR family NAD(P)-dependent oxidoreductase [Sphingomicrobium sp.]
MRLAGHHALVTGGGSGIGAAIARALAAEGARLTLVGRRRDRLEQVAAELDAAVAPADVTDRAEVDRAFAAARDANGPIAILVNNAGAAESAPFGATNEALWRRTMSVNLDAVMHCCAAALDDLLAAQEGRIVTIASTAGLRGYAFTAAYCAAKHGAVGLMRALAAEYGRTGLTANAVCPGFTDTELVAGAARTIQDRTGRSQAEARAELARLNPSGRLIGTDEVAALVRDLVLSTRNGEAVEIA